LPRFPPPWPAVLAGAVLALLAACARDASPLQLVGPAMGTTYSVTITRLPAGIRRTQVEQAIAEVLRDADRHLSGWNDASELVRFNSTLSTDWVPVSPTLLATVRQAQRVAEASDGAFDITVGPLVQAWGFGAGAQGRRTPPADGEIRRLLDAVGAAKLELRDRPPSLRKMVPELSIDLDGIAPGWAVDRIAARFDTLGIEDYLVELGGEVKAQGRSPQRRPWRVAVEKPAAGERSAQAIIELDGLGVSTSGDYRDYYELQGRRIGHTIDPRTGRPVAHDLASVTVVCPSAAEADAWATALMVLGPAAGMDVANRRQLAVLFIRRGSEAGSFTESESPAFARLRRSSPASL